MILDCPFCKARFLISATVFSNGPRRVRCGRCAHSWEAETPNNMDVVMVPLVEADGTPSSSLTSAPQALPETATASHPSAPMAPGTNLPAIPSKPMSIGTHMAIALGGFLVLILALLVINRETLSGRWPIFEGVFNSVGLHINHTGENLRIEDVRSELRYDAGIVRLVVEGKVHNVAEKYQLVPNIKASAIGPDGSEIQSWQIDAPAAKLDPGETVPFETTIKAPDKTVVNVNLEFIELKNGDE